MFNKNIVEIDLLNFCNPEKTVFRRANCSTG